MKSQEHKRKILAFTLTFLLTAAMVLWQASTEVSAISYPVTIDNTTFPDPSFRSYVINNIAIDSELSQAEAEAVTSLDVSFDVVSYEIEDLKGVEYFVNLKTLNCSRNNLTSLDVSKNTDLESLDCMLNNLTSLNVSKNTNLESLECIYNDLTSLDVSKNTALLLFDCSRNNLNSLDVSKNTALLLFDCGSNNLNNLDVSKNTDLSYLACGYNNLNSLDVSKNIDLDLLNCSHNKLLDIIGLSSACDLSGTDQKVSVLVGANPQAPPSYIGTRTYSFENGHNISIDPSTARYNAGLSRFETDNLNTVGFATSLVAGKGLSGEITFNFNNVDINPLQGRIAEAGALRDGAVVGNKPGQYPEKAVSDLSKAIEDAKAVLNKQNVTQAQLDQAEQALSKAMEDFKAQKIKPKDQGTSPDTGNVGFETTPVMLGVGALLLLALLSGNTVKRRKHSR